MPNLLLTNLLSYKAYFQDVADKNIAIKGFKYGDRDVVVNANRSNLDDNFLWVQPYESVRYEDADSDNPIKRKEAVISFMKAASTKAFATEESDYQECEGVMDQVMSKLLRDKRGSEIATVWTMIATDISSVTARPVEALIGSTNYRGWELKITFMDNANFGYDASKWI